MTRWQAWLLHGSNFLVGLTGIVYAVMRYCLTPADEFAVVNHPLQPDVQHLHVLFAPLLVFAVGLVWQRHALQRAKIPEQPRRLSGFGLMYAAFPMIFSGYLLQISVSDSWRQVWVIVHVASSVVWLGGYVGHQFFRWVADRLRTGDARAPQGEA